MSATTKMALALLCNIIIVLATFFVVRSYFKTEDGKYKWAQGAWKFKFFTTDSNVVAAVAALIVIPFEVLALVRVSIVVNVLEAIMNKVFSGLTLFKTSTHEVASTLDIK